ncbi:MAG: mannitol dehydrogenase family protein, partial [Rhodoglobus sp.]|nr:mannitol dehydrogenase family protein [Rhodoglobus sp.]
DSPLDQLTIPTPRFDRSRVKAGIAHIGVGGFHRAHQAVYLDDLLALGQERGWGILGVGVLPSDHAMRDALREQDHLYTVVERHPDGSLDPRVIGSMVGFLFVPDDPDAAAGRLADPAIRIVSLTITEGGYHLDPSSSQLVVDDALRADLESPTTPRTAFGLIVEALVRRRAAGIPPFSVLSCDNLPGNGDLARRAIVQFASLRDPELGQWMGTEVAFPNSMVDRITPRTTDADRVALEREFGVDDSWPVVCEPFRQWVVEDDFPAGRPQLERVGVQLVGDVVPYELMKLRLLNGSHQAIAYVAALAGIELVHDAASHPLIVEVLARYMEEAEATLPPVPGVDLAAYRAQLLERFANPGVRDTVARLAQDASDRIPAFVLPVVHERVGSGSTVRWSALLVAAWARYAAGKDDTGRPIDVVDLRRDTVVDRAVRAEADPRAFLEERALFGDLADHEQFVAVFASALASLRENGALETLRRWLADAV